MYKNNIYLPTDRYKLVVINCDGHNKNRVVLEKKYKREYSGKMVDGSPYHSTHTSHLGIAILIEKYDLHPINTHHVEYDTNSFQIRPKGVFKDSKGYYFKPFDKIVRIEGKDAEQLDEFIDEVNNSNKQYHY